MVTLRRYEHVSKDGRLEIFKEFKVCLIAIGRRRGLFASETGYTSNTLRVSEFPKLNNI